MVKHKNLKSNQYVVFLSIFAVSTVAWVGCSSSPKEGDSAPASSTVVEPVADGAAPPAGTDSVPTNPEASPSPSSGDPQAGLPPAGDPTANAFGAPSVNDPAPGSSPSATDPNAAAMSTVDMSAAAGGTTASTDETPKPKKRRGISGLKKKKHKAHVEETPAPAEAQAAPPAPAQETPPPPAPAPMPVQAAVPPPPPAPAYTPPPAPVYTPPPSTYTPPSYTNTSANSPYGNKQMGAEVAQEGGLLQNKTLMGGIILGVVALLGISFFMRSRKPY